PPRPAAGERLGHHRGNYAVEVERTATGQHGLAGSSTPLMSSVGTGHSEPIDLSLATAGGDYTPPNPAVATSLPGPLGRGRRFPAANLVLDLVGAGDRSAARTDGKLFYANAQADTDVLMAPLPTGVETYYQLRSPAAPESFALRSRDVTDTFRLTTGGGAE